MSLKPSYALICATLLFSNPACTQKRDIVHDVSEKIARAPNIPNIPINIDKAADFAKKDADNNSKKSESMVPTTTTKASPTTEPKSSAPAAAENKEPFSWKIPFVYAKSALSHGLAQRNSPKKSTQEDAAQEELKDAIDYSSDAIKKEAFAKISFENLDDLVEIMKNPDTVIYKGQAASEKAMAEKIKNLNEESYCKVSFKGDVRKDDFFRLDIESLSSTAFDTAHVVNIFKANYKNTSGEVLLTCTHTTSNFFMQEAQIDFAKWITFYEFAGNKIETKGYKNPLSEERKIDAIRITDAEKFKKVILDENSKDTFALLNGEIVDMADGYSAVANKKDTQSCIVSDVAGTVTTDLIYVRVSKGILEPTPQENPNANMYVTYRADTENFFIMSCFMAKAERWNKLMDTAKGIFEFGAMDRITLRKKGSELQKIQDDYEASIRN